MKVSRRGIFKMLPAVPMAVKQAQKEAEKLVGASIDNPRDEYLFSRDFGEREGMKGSALVRFLRNLGGLPGWKQRELRRDARRNRRLDPDVAALQSVSLSGKLAIQANRTEKRMTERYFGNLIEDEERDEFLRKHGIDWL